MKYVLANWKMFLGRARAAELFGMVQAGLAERFPVGPLPVEVVLCPSFVSLVPLHATMDQRLVHLGAQDCHWEREGPFTGAISPIMLRGLVEYVLIGHSERRAAGDTDDQIAKKVAAAADAGLTPILFVGEDDPTEEALERAGRRLSDGLARTDPSKHGALIVYEPSWAIGADRAAPAERVGAVVSELKQRLRQLGVSNPRVIYGGTVTADNVDELAALEELDGVGATRAGLDAHGFLSIVDSVVAATES